MCSIQDVLNSSIPVCIAHSLHEESPVISRRNLLKGAIAASVAASGLQGITERGKHTIYDAPTVETPAQSFMDAYDRPLDIKAYLTDPAIYWLPKG